MCVDLKNLEKNQQANFSPSTALLTIAVTVLLFALLVIGWRTLPGAKTVDDVLQIEAPQISRIAAVGGEVSR